MTEITVYKNLVTMVDGRRDAITNALHSFGIDPRLFLSTCYETLKDPKILQCPAPSILNSIVRCAQLGLSLHKELGQAYLVPYNTKRGMQCQMQIGYRGLILMMYRSGSVTYAAAGVVKENDEFEYSYGNGANHYFKHKIPLKGDRGKPIAAWAKVVLKEGGEPFEVMPLDDIEDVRKKSKAKSEDSPWHTDWDEMAKKTVLKRLSKYQPIKTEVLARVMEDEYADRDIDNDSIPVDYDEINAEKLNGVKSRLTEKAKEQKSELPDWDKISTGEKIKLLETAYASASEEKKKVLDELIPIPYRDMENDDLNQSVKIFAKCEIYIPVKLNVGQ